MGNSDKSTTLPNLTSVALELFKGRSIQPGISPHQIAVSCFRDAKAFMETAEQILDARLDLHEDEINPLDLAFAPNLKRTHPINLMSRAWGDLDGVKRVLAYLDENPNSEVYEPYNWGKPEINQARALFPAVVNRTQEYASTK